MPSNCRIRLTQFDFVVLCVVCLCVCVCVSVYLSANGGIGVSATVSGDCRQHRRCCCGDDGLWRRCVSVWGRSYGACVFHRGHLAVCAALDTATFAVNSGKSCVVALDAELRHQLPSASATAMLLEVEDDQLAGMLGVCHVPLQGIAEGFLSGRQRHAISRGAHQFVNIVGQVVGEVDLVLRFTAVDPALAPHLCHPPALRKSTALAAGGVGSGGSCLAAPSSSSAPSGPPPQLPAPLQGVSTRSTSDVVATIGVAPASRDAVVVGAGVRAGATAGAGSGTGTAAAASTSASAAAATQATVARTATAVVTSSTSASRAHLAARKPLTALSQCVAAERRSMYPPPDPTLVFPYNMQPDPIVQTVPRVDLVRELLVRPVDCMPPVPGGSPNPSAVLEFEDGEAGVSRPPAMFFSKRPSSGRRNTGRLAHAQWLTVRDGAPATAGAPPVTRPAAAATGAAAVPADTSCALGLTNHILQSLPDSPLDRARCVGFACCSRGVLPF